MTQTRSTPSNGTMNIPRSSMISVSSEPSAPSQTFRLPPPHHHRTATLGQRPPPAPTTLHDDDGHSSCPCFGRCRLVRFSWYPMVNANNERVDTHGPGVAGYTGLPVKCYPSKTDCQWSILCTRFCASVLSIFRGTLLTSARLYSHADHPLAACYELLRTFT